MEPWTAMRGMCNILLLHLLYRFAAAVKTSTKLTITNTNHESSPSSSSSGTPSSGQSSTTESGHGNGWRWWGRRTKQHASSYGRWNGWWYATGTRAQHGRWSSTSDAWRRRHDGSWTRYDGRWWPNGWPYGSYGWWWWRHGRYGRKSNAVTTHDGRWHGWRYGRHATDGCRTSDGWWWWRWPWRTRAGKWTEWTESSPSYGYVWPETDARHLR
uniref:Putative secreted peptide n=1 Tax=Anopheles braziliensis TaxID=58242 RepID=A0A2M3ZEI9_9DIPT